MQLTQQNLLTFQTLLNKCMRSKHIVLTKPEYCLSLKLRSIELCQQATSPDGQLLLDIHSFYQQHARDLMDESDEILSVKYQLVYSVGITSTLDGGELRWQVSQDVLKLASEHLATLARDERFVDSIEYAPSPTCPQAYPMMRLLDEQPYVELCELICADFLTKKLASNMQTQIADLRSDQVKMFSEFVLGNEVETTSAYSFLLTESGDDGNLKNVLYILRGLLTYNVLYVVLSKRWKVEFGVNTEPAHHGNQIFVGLIF